MTPRSTPPRTTRPARSSNPKKTNGLSRNASGQFQATKRQAAPSQASSHPHADRRNALRYAIGLVPTIPVKCSRSDTADPNPTSIATRSTGRSVVSSIPRARFTLAWITHCSGLTLKPPVQGAYADCGLGGQRGDGQVLGQPVFDPVQQRRQVGVRGGPRAADADGAGRAGAPLCWSDISGCNVAGPAASSEWPLWRSKESAI